MESGILPREFEPPISRKTSFLIWWNHILCLPSRETVQFLDIPAISRTDVDKTRAAFLVKVDIFLNKINWFDL